MKILFCTNAFEVVSNGPAKFAHLLLNLEKMYPNCEVRILTEDVSKPNAAVYKQSLNIPTVLKPFGMFLRMFQYHKTAFKIKKSDYNFDVLIYNNVIVSLWSAIRFKNTIGFINDDNNAGVSWRNGFFKWKWEKGHVFFITEWLACKLLSKIVVNSNYLKSVISNRYKVPSAKIVRLYKAIEFPPAITKQANSTPVILFVKNDYQRGGLFILTKALLKSGIQCKFIVAGTPNHVENELQEQLNASKISLQFEGIVSQARIYELMQEADIFCVPSYKEALGVANMEAMAFGCTIVTSNVGGIPEVLDHGENGWMVSPGNVDALADTLLFCLNEPERCAEKRNKAYKFIANFSSSAMYNSFVKEVLNFEE